MAQPMPQQMIGERAVITQSDGVPPPTKAQALYWRELCQVVALRGASGLRDGEWPPDLAPSRLTLRSLVERRLLVRRSGAWHLRRRWQDTLDALAAIAVPTPPLRIAERPAPDLPTFAEIEAYEEVCLWLDTQPRRRARLPFTELPDVSGDVPRGMRKYRLVRHTSECFWVLSPTWKDRLLKLWHGVMREQGTRESAELEELAPVSVACGLDTWYLNRIDHDGLPLHLRRQLDDLQAEAKEVDDEITTPWVYDGAPLKLYRSGVSAKQGGGVSWSYILRNASLALLIRRTPLGGIVAQVRFSSECLWRLSPKTAFLEADRLIRRMWGKTHGTWQVSQAHLAHDVMHAAIELEQLSRYVSRSRTQALYEAARQEIAALSLPKSSEEDFDEGGIDWGEIYEVDDGFGYDPLLMVGDPMTTDEPAEERAVTAYRWGRRLSGVAWSLRSPIAFVQYDKALEVRRTGKTHMPAIWQAHGYTGTESVVRHEARLKRAALRDLRLPGVDAAVLDDPLRFLEHLPEVWATVVGQAEECPAAVEAAWIRRVVPTEDANRSRWPTDPAWRVVQDAAFTPEPAPVRRLLRRKQQAGDVDRRVKVMYGALVSAVALSVPDGDTWDVSKAMGMMAPQLTEEAMKPGKDFGHLVRERRHKWDLPVPKQGKVLPFRRRAPVPGQADPTTLDSEPENEAARAEWRLAQAERRMLDLLDALDQAGLSPVQRAALEAAYQHEAQVLSAETAVRM